MRLVPHGVIQFAAGCRKSVVNKQQYDKCVLYACIPNVIAKFQSVSGVKNDLKKEHAGYRC